MTKFGASCDTKASTAAHALQLTMLRASGNPSKIIQLAYQGMGGRQVTLQTRRARVRKHPHPIHYYLNSC